MAFERQLSTNRGVGFHNINILVGTQNKKSKFRKQIHAGKDQTLHPLIPVGRKTLCPQHKNGIFMFKMSNFMLLSK
jgi:hypothetical protein